MNKFKELGLIEPILKSIEELHFEEPTEIQAKTIPLAIAGKDIIAGSATGSGKTLAFASGIIQNSEKGAGIQALVLTPTRELAQQIAESFTHFSKYRQLKVVVVYGGVSINPQIHDLETADVVIGTPGRTLDHLQRRTMDLSSCKTVVLDEADRMLDMGFIDDVELIIKACPKERQTLLFSATIHPTLQKLAKNHMKDPVKVSAVVYVDASKLKQVYYDVDDNMKFSLLVHLLKQEKKGLVMVFCNSRNTTDFVATNLKQHGIQAQAIHGGLSQDKRNRTLSNFHSQEVFVLVCTDVAARGLDIKGVTHVYNYDSPKESKQYIHRIGRTARAGSEGKAINLLANRDYDNFQRVLQDNDVTVEKMEKPYIEKLRIQRVDHGPQTYGGRPHGGSRGGPSRGGFNRGPRTGGYKGPRSSSKGPYRKR